MIGAIVLAAGRGTRFGGPKVTALLRGTPVVRHVVDRLQEGGLAPIVVVCAPGDASVRAAVDGSGVTLVENPVRDEGLSASLRLGVESLPGTVDGFVVALGDQPLIDPEVIRRMLGAWRDSNAAAVVPEYLDGRGNPVLFDNTMRRHLVALTGDAGARDLLQRMDDRVVAVAVDAPAPQDVDTPGDLRALEE